MTNRREANVTEASVNRGGEWSVRDEAEGATSSRVLFICHEEESGFFSKGIVGTTEGLLLWK